MDNKSRPASESDQQERQQADQHKVKNPFEDHQSAEKSISESREELEKEQQYKEALTERD